MEAVTHFHCTRRMPLNPQFPASQSVLQATEILAQPRAPWEWFGVLTVPDSKCPPFLEGLHKAGDVISPGTPRHPLCLCQQQQILYKATKPGISTLSSDPFQPRARPQTACAKYAGKNSGNQA